ncbi:unnamed protein product [Sphagnum balticum]
MTILEAYERALEEEDDPQERNEVSDNNNIKLCIVEEVIEAMTEIRNQKTEVRSSLSIIEPMFKLVAFWFIIGIRVGKILRDHEMAKQ